MVPPRPPIPPPNPPLALPFASISSPTPSSTFAPTTNPPPLDAFGKFLQLATSCFRHLGWDNFIASSRGRGNITPNVHLLDHPAANLLHSLSTIGAPAQGTLPAWSLSHRDAMMARGSHSSASAHYHFLRNEMADMMAKGYWTILPYRLVRHLPNLRISNWSRPPTRPPTSNNR